MNICDIKGIIVPILTPMYENGKINEEELKNQAERMISSGIHGIFTCGTNGEGYALGEEEKEQVLEICVKTANGRVPVYAGSGCITTADTIAASKAAERLGADALSVITPYFAAASQDEIYQHYKAVAESVSLPIILYNIPARTGNSILPCTAKKLSQVDNIVGIKDSSGNFDNILQYIELTRNSNFAVLSGNDSLILWTLIAGGKGGIAGCANVFPQNMVGIYKNFAAGNFDEARKCQDAIRPFRNCFEFGNPNTIVKAATEMLGYNVGRCRAPFGAISDECRANIAAVLENMKAQGIF